MASLELPNEVVAILPSDPFAQLELAHKIAQAALAQKTAQMESEGQQLREALLQKQNQIKSLERRVSSLELELQDMVSKSKQAVEDAHRLQNEKAALIETVKKLNRENARLDTLRKNLIQQLHDDDEPNLEPSVANADVSGERLVSEVLNSISKPAQHAPAGAGPYGGYAPPPSAAPAGGAYGMNAGGGGFNSRMPAATPGFSSTSGRPIFAGATPQPSAAATPYMHMGGGGGGGAVGGGSPPKVDGKEFFRQARAQLSYEQFSQFLHNIKELNAGRQSREETLRRARDIFGPAHQDMYVMFEALLSRHGSTL